MLESCPGGCEFDTFFPANFLSGVFLPPTSSEACEKQSRWLRKENCVSSGVRKPGNKCASPAAMI